MGIFVDVRVIKIHLIVFDPRKSIADLPLASPQRFHLSAAQNDASLKRLKNVIIAPSFRVAQNVGHEVKFEPRNPKFETTSKFEPCTRRWLNSPKLSTSWN